MRELQTIQFKPLQGTELWAQALEMDVKPSREDRSSGEWTVGDATVEFYSHGDRYKATCHQCTDIPCEHIIRVGMEAIPKGLNIPSASSADRPEEIIPEDGQKQVTDVPESAADDGEDDDGQEARPVPEDTPQAAEPVQKTDGGVTEGTNAAPVPDDALEDALEEPDPRGVDTDPLEWIPDQFIDRIEGTPAINKKGFSVLCQHYGITVNVEKTVGPMETDFEYAECRAVAKTPEGQEYVAYGSAHTNRERGDDPTMLLEYADTRAYKRAASRATGTGMLAVEELQSE